MSERWRELRFQRLDPFRDLADMQSEIKPKEIKIQLG